LLFSEKLDLLMNLSGTSNSALARHINLDASYISRLRRGDRAPSKNENYLLAISQYFAKFMAVDTFRSGLCHALQTPPSQIPIDLEPASAIILDWLYDQKAVETKSIGKLLEQVSHFTFPTSNAIFDLASLFGTLNPKETSTYLDLHGKREAVLTLLATALMSEATETLYLYSDESMEWLIGDKKFTSQWSILMSKIIQKGHKIVIVHTVNRGLDEMLTAIREWLPLYMTGSIEPYYYPRTRDDVYKHTLFILEKKTALISRSVSRSTNPPIVHVFNEPRTVAHYQKEFQDYLNLCRPLMKIITVRHNGGVLEMIEEFEAEASNTITLREGLPSLTMPVATAESIMIRSGLESQQVQYMSGIQRKRHERLLKQLQDFEHTDLLLLPDKKSLQELTKSAEANGLQKDSNTNNTPDALRVKFLGLVGLSDAVYTLQEFSEHLAYTIHLMKTYPNYHVILLEDNFSSDCTVTIRENVGVLVIKDSAPNVLFAINESRMTAAFLDYTTVITGKVRLNGTERKAVLKRLEGMYAALMGRRPRQVPMQQAE